MLTRTSRQIATSDPLELVCLRALMGRTQGVGAVKIGLIDGPVNVRHCGLAPERITAVSPFKTEVCRSESSEACQHGTFVAGILSASRGSGAPAVCPGCSLLVRPIFSEDTPSAMPTAGPRELASAIIETVDAGAHVINLSVGVAATGKDEDCLRGALDYAMKRSVLIVAAAGNQRGARTSFVAAHPWVIPVAGCRGDGELAEMSNFGLLIGLRGLRAPGSEVRSLAATRDLRVASGTSVAAPFVTGTIALLWSLFPEAGAADLKRVVLGGTEPRRALIPPLLDAEGSYRTLTRLHQSEAV